MAFKASNPGIFSRLSAKRKQSDGKETSNDDNEPDDNEELAEEYASLTDEHMLEKTNIAVQSEIGVKHLVMYDVCLQPFRSGIWKQTFIFQGWDTQGNVQAFWNSM